MELKTRRSPSLDAINATIMRGGTSRAIFIDGEALPFDPDLREKVILQVFGSPDPRQIDGLGGADPLTSKLAIIDRPDSEFADRADVIYTFGQVGIADADVDWHSLCGNVTSAVGVYAIQEGLVKPDAPLTTVRVFNTNLQRMLFVTVPVKDGSPVEHGDFIVPGVPGSGAEISVDFADTAGAATGALLPTGRPLDVLDVPGVGPIETTLIDIGNAHVFVRASDLGLTGTESAAEIDADEALRDRLEAIRGTAAMRMSMIHGPASSARDQSPATPILGVVAPPAAYSTPKGSEPVQEGEVDLVARLQFMQQTHKTFAGTSTVCTGVAARIPGTLVHQVARTGNTQTVRIGHPTGVIKTDAIVQDTDDGFKVMRATLGRTARRIMQGTVYLPASQHAADDMAVSAF